METSEHRHDALPWEYGDWSHEMAEEATRLIRGGTPPLTAARLARKTVLANKPATADTETT